MFERNKNPAVQTRCSIDTTPYFWCDEAVLLEVKNGKGALRWVRREYDSDCKALSALMLNDKPILQADIPACPTCEGLLATGYGIDNTDCVELREIADKINAPYEGIHQSVSTISSILGLLQDGMYVLADCDVFPTDGNGRFFWDVPNKLTPNPATACCLTYIENECGCVSGIPVFLYPSQSTEKYDADRVKYHQSLLSDRQRFPRAIAYHCNEFCSILLDGHHKAAACALNSVAVPTLVIIPCSGIGYKPGMRNKMIESTVHFCEIELPVHLFTRKQMEVVRNTVNQWRNKEDVHFIDYSIINRKWEPEYQKTARTYPNVEKLSYEIVLNITELNDSAIEELLANAVGINARKLESIIRRLMRMEEQKAMNLALRCAKLNSDPELMKTAFQTLTLFKNNTDIEQLFIDWLINDDDPHSVLRKIADNHWTVGDII